MKKETTLFLILFFVGGIFHTSFSVRSSLKKLPNQDSVITKTYFKKGLRYEKDYVNGKLVQTREFKDNYLMARYPIYRETLRPSSISLRSGNNFFIKGTIDTLEIINPEIPPMNFGIRVSNGNITRLSHGIYLLEEFSAEKQSIDSMKVWVTVFQPENKKLGLGNFDSDSITFFIR